MQQLPKLVRERLRVSVTGEHPDADLLTAYLEQSLTAQERLKMNDHLASCSECRQVLALAAPETISAAATTEGRRVPPPTWLHWNILRWGAAAACLVIVGAAVMLNVSHKAGVSLQDTEMQTAHRAEPAASAPAPSAPAAAPQNEAKAAPHRNLTSEKAVPPRTMRLDEKPASQPSSKKERGAVISGVGGGIGGGAFRTAPQQKSKAEESAQAPAVVSRADSVGALVAGKTAAPLESSANAIRDQKDMETAGASGAAESPPPSSSAGGELSDRKPLSMTQTVEVTGAAPAVETDSVSVAKSAGRQKQEPAKQAAANQAAAIFSPKPLAQVAATTKGMADFKTPRWSLSENGLPQRSFDSGKNWEEVQVDHKRGFRALAAVGMDVWVGGKDGLLYHSGDLGLHWSQITPASSGANLTADIVRIEFADPQHGRLIAGDGQSWVTSDGGKTWEKH